MPEQIVSSKSKICLMKFFLEIGRKQRRKKGQEKRKNWILCGEKNVITFPKMYASRSYWDPDIFYLFNKYLLGAFSIPTTPLIEITVGERILGEIRKKEEMKRQVR